MSLTYSSKIATDGLLMYLDTSNNKSYPTDLPVKNGLVMWMDAADDTTFSYSSGTTVSQWRDKSGFNYHMGPKVNGPTRSVVLNSRKVLAFTTAQTIGNNTMNLASSANTVFVVSRLTGVTNGRVLTCNADASGNNWLLGHHGGTYNDYFAEGWVSDGGALDANWRMYMGDWSGTSTDLANLYSNGTAITTNSTAASQGPKYLGVNYYSNEVSTCEVAEIIVFDRVLSTAERRLVHTYLGQKWGISNTDRSIIDLSGLDDNGLFGNGTVANMPDYDYYNKGTLSFTQTSNDTILTPLPITSTPALSNFTYEVWTKLNRFPTAVSPANAYGNTYRVGFLFGASYYQGAGLLWYGYPTGDAFSLYAFIRGSDAYRSTNGYPFALNQYYHCVMVNNYGANKLQLYINGTLYNEVSTATAEYDAGLAADAGNIGISKAQVDGGGTANYSHYDGSVAAARIYNKALSAAEVAQNYEAQKSKFANTIVQQGLVLNLDAGNPYSYAGAGATIYDVSGAGNDFTIQGNVTWDAINGFSNFDGNSTGNGNKIYRNSFPQNLKTSQGGNGYTIMVVARSTYAGSWRKLIGNGDGENYIDLYQNSTGYTWHQDGSGETLYVDGVQVGNDTYVMYNAGFHFYAATNLNNGLTSNPTYALTIGNEPNSSPNGTNTYPWIGNIAIVLMYNRVLTTTELLQNYNALKGRFGL